MKLCKPLDRRHLHLAVGFTYLLALFTVAHLITQSTESDNTLATPPLCLHTPFAGISHAVVLGEPRHTNRFFACALNSSVRVEPPPVLNLSAGSG